jgi:hypothetical protein
VTQSAKSLKALEKDGLSVMRSRYPSGERCIVVNSANSKSPFADVRARQAAQYIIDRRSLLKAYFTGSMNQLISKCTEVTGPTTCPWSVTITIPPKRSNSLGRPGHICMTTAFLLAEITRFVHLKMSGGINRSHFDA